MKWTVAVTRRVQKQITRLPAVAAKNIAALIRDIEINGPIRGNWPNYGPLGNDFFHCHIKKGKPTYVVVWEVKDKKVRLVEVVYAGTHEKAPY
jgi:mRNA-degrading endonuclease RelE of RelBE toxin-antitoxin system